MKRPIESDYISQVAYTRALEAYCDRQERIKRAEEAFEASQQNIQSYLEKDNSQQEQGEPVAQAVVAGCLYDFMGWLTSRRTRITLSGRDNAGRPAVDAIVDFSKMRGLKLDGALVKSWQTALATAPQQRTWVGLTNKEIEFLCYADGAMRQRTATQMAFAVQAKLKEKNQ